MFTSPIRVLLSQVTPQCHKCNGRRGLARARTEVPARRDCPARGPVPAHLLLPAIEGATAPRPGAAVSAGRRSLIHSGVSVAGGVALARLFLSFFTASSCAPRCLDLALRFFFISLASSMLRCDFKRRPFLSFPVPQVPRRWSARYVVCPWFHSRFEAVSGSPAGMLERDRFAYSSVLLFAPRVPFAIAFLGMSRCSRFFILSRFAHGSIDYIPDVWTLFTFNSHYLFYCYTL